MNAQTLVADFMKDRDALMAELATAHRSSADLDHVVVFDSGAALFGIQTVMDGNRVEGIKVSGLRNATRLTKVNAEKLTAGGNIQNGAGEIAFPMKYTDALASQIQKLAVMIEVIATDND